MSSWDGGFERISQHHPTVRLSPHDSDVNNQPGNWMSTRL